MSQESFREKVQEKPSSFRPVLLPFCKCKIYLVCLSGITPFLFFAGVALSAFYYGYMVTQLPGGVLARKLGGATMLGLSVGICGALTLLTPLAARAHVGVLIALRIASGMAEVRNTTISLLFMLQVLCFIYSLIPYHTFHFPYCFDAFLVSLLEVFPVLSGLCNPSRT